MADANPAPTPDPVQVVDPPPDLCIFCFSKWCQDQAARVRMSPKHYSRYMQITASFFNDVTSYYKFRVQMRHLLQHPDTQNRHLQPYWEIFHRVYILRITVEDDPLLFYPIDLCIRLNIITGFDFFVDPEQANRIRELNSKESDSINAQIRLDLERHRSAKAKGKAPEHEQAPLEGATVNNVETQKDTPERNYVVNSEIKLFQAVDPPPDLCKFCLRDWCQDQAARVQMSRTDYSKYMQITGSFSNDVNPYKLFWEKMRNFLEQPDKGYRHLLPYWEIFHSGYILRMPVEDDPLFFYPIDLCIRLNIITGFDFFADPEQANRIRELNSKESDSINAQIRRDLERHRSAKAKGKAQELEQAPLEGTADNIVETQKDNPARNYVVNPGIKLIQAVDPPPAALCIFCFRDWCQDQAARVQMSRTDYSKYVQITGNFSNDVKVPYRLFREQMKNFLEHEDKGYRHLLPYWEIFHCVYIQRIPVEDDPLFFYPIDLSRRLNIITGFDFFADPEQANRIRKHNSETVDKLNGQIRYAFQRARYRKEFETQNARYNDPYRNRKAPELLEGAADNRVETPNYVVNLGINSTRPRPTAVHQTFMPDLNLVPTPVDPAQTVGPPPDGFPDGFPDLCISCFRDWCQDQVARLQMSATDYSKYMQIMGNFFDGVNPYNEFRQQMRNLLQHPDTQNKHLQPYWDVFHRGYFQKMPVEDDPLYFFPIDLCRRLNITPAFDFFADPEQANWIPEHDSKRADMINHQIRLASEMERHFKFPKRDPSLKRKAPELEQATLEGAAADNVETQTDTTMV